MPGHRETDLRLKTYLNADQASRERLCIAILFRNREYTQVEARRPEGGPDQKRDIQAIYRGSLVVWGAVGFQNSVTDSRSDKRNAKQKFKGDLDAALTENPDLKGFVFFTNVDLTPKEVDELKSYAISRKLSHVEIFWREQLRIALDAPEGLALRYQCLDMELSHAEQAAFFSRFGSELEGLVTRQHETVEARLQRLEFLHDMSRPLNSLILHIDLIREFTAAELGPFGVLGELHGELIGAPSWHLGGRDDYDTSGSQGSGTLSYGQAVLCWRDGMPAPAAFQRSRGVRFVRRSTSTLVSGVRFDGQQTSLTAEDLDAKEFALHVTRNLLGKMRRVALIANGWVLLTTSLDKAGCADRASPPAGWPQGPASHTEPMQWAVCDGPFWFVDFSRKLRKAEGSALLGYAP